MTPLLPFVHRYFMGDKAKCTWDTKNSTFCNPPLKQKILHPSKDFLNNHSFALPRFLQTIENSCTTWSFFLPSSLYTDMSGGQFVMILLRGVPLCKANNNWSRLWRHSKFWLVCLSCTLIPKAVCPTCRVSQSSWWAALFRMHIFWMNLWYLC